MLKSQKLNSKKRSTITLASLEDKLDTHLMVKNRPVGQKYKKLHPSFSVVDLRYSLAFNCKAAYKQRKNVS